MGDTRKHAHFVPITPRVLEAFLDAGFVLREDVIKLQHKMKSTRKSWFEKNYNFLLIGHEHLYVFRKLKENESKAKGLTMKGTAYMRVRPYFLSGEVWYNYT